MCWPDTGINSDILLQHQLLKLNLKGFIIWNILFWIMLSLAKSPFGRVEQSCEYKNTLRQRSRHWQRLDVDVARCIIPVTLQTQEDNWNKGCQMPYLQFPKKISISWYITVWIKYFRLLEIYLFFLLKSKILGILSFVAYSACALIKWLCNEVIDCKINGNI